MEQSHPIPLEGLGVLLKKIHGGGSPRRSSFLACVSIPDSGTNHVGLAALIQLALQEGHHLRAAGGIHPQGLDRGAPCRPFGDGGDLHLPIQGQRQRAGNRRGRQDEEIRMLSFGHQGLALVHPELLLFIDDRQPQFVKFYPGLQHGMGSHQQRKLSGGQRFGQLRPGGLVQRAGQKTHRDIPRGQKLGEDQGMLAGQDLRGGHHDALKPIAMGHSNSKGRDRRFAGAHLSLEEPVHRPGIGHVPRDLLHRLFLPGGQLERETFLPLA